MGAGRGETPCVEGSLGQAGDSAGTAAVLPAQCVSNRRVPSPATIQTTCSHSPATHQLLLPNIRVARGPTPWHNHRGTAGQHRQLPLPRANLGLALPAPCPCWVVSILSLGAPLACAPSPKPAHSSGRRLRWPVAPCLADSVPLQGQLRSPIWHHQPRQVPIAPRHQCHCAPCWGYKSPHPSQPTPVPPDQQGLNAPLLSKGETGWAVKEIK